MSRSLSVSRTQTIPCQKSFHQGNLVINKEVSEALRNDGPVVTLESTIITHGMPYPTNMEMATEVRISLEIIYIIWYILLSQANMAFVVTFLI